MLCIEDINIIKKSVSILLVTLTPIFVVFESFTYIIMV